MMKRVAFLGSKPIGHSLLKEAISLLPEPRQLVGVLCARDLQDDRSCFEAFRGTCASAGIPFETAVTSADLRAFVGTHRPDTVIVSGWYQRIPLSEFPETEFYGFHFSLLPRYRGNAPLVWQIINGETELGVTFFRFAEGIDEGDVVAQASFSLGGDETIADALGRVERVTLDLLRANVIRILDGTVTLHPQDHAAATYCALRMPEDGRIDWSWSAAKVHNFVRAQTRPYPGAFTHLPDGRTVRIWATEVHPSPYHGVPGAVAERGEGSVVVTCGEGAVRVLEAQIDGEPPRTPAATFTSLRTRLS